MYVVLAAYSCRDSRGIARRGERTAFPLPARMVLREGAPRPFSLTDGRIKPSIDAEIAISKVDLEKATRADSFRADLFHRLAATSLKVPPLREREDDAVLLLEIFVDEAKQKLGKPDFSPRSQRIWLVKLHDRPANVRELRLVSCGPSPSADQPTNDGERWRPVGLF